MTIPWLYAPFSTYLKLSHQILGLKNLGAREERTRAVLEPPGQKGGSSLCGVRKGRVGLEKGTRWEEGQDFAEFLL